MTEDGESVGAGPQRMVYESYRNAAQQRERVTAAPLVPDHVLDTEITTVEYHAALMEYYSRLAPHLQERPYFNDRIPLFSRPMDGRREQLAKDIAEYYRVEVRDVLELLDEVEKRGTQDYKPDEETFEPFEPQPDEETVRGLRSLRHWRSRTTTDVIEEEHAIKGKTSRTVERAEYLPRDVAMRVHDVLDSAASALGYNVRPGRDLVQSNIDTSGEINVEGVEPK